MTGGSRVKRLDSAVEKKWWWDEYDRCGEAMVWKWWRRDQSRIEEIG